MDFPLRSGSATALKSTKGGRPLFLLIPTTPKAFATHKKTPRRCTQDDSNDYLDERAVVPGLFPGVEKWF